MAGTSYRTHLSARTQFSIVDERAHRGKRTVKALLAYVEELAAQADARGKEAEAIAMAKAAKEAEKASKATDVEETEEAAKAKQAAMQPPKPPPTRWAATRWRA